MADLSGAAATGTATAGVRTAQHNRVQRAKRATGEENEPSRRGKKKQRLTRKKLTLAKSLPYEITAKIFRDLEFVDQVRLGLTCPKLYRILKIFHPAPIPLNHDWVKEGQVKYALGEAIKAWSGFRRDGQYRFVAYPIYKFLNVQVYGYKDEAKERTLTERYSDFRWNGILNRLRPLDTMLPDPHARDPLDWHRAAFRVIEMSLTPTNLEAWRYHWSYYLIFRSFAHHWQRFVEQSASKDKHSSRTCECHVCRGTL